MDRKNNLFIATLNVLHKAGALKDIILIGSWCHYFYRLYFGNPPQIPAVRTFDIDFLIPNPPKAGKDINVPEILETLDFTPVHSYPSGYTKYVHPELELEFLTPDLGRGKGNKPYVIKRFHINAQGLRYLNLLQAHTMKIKHRDIMVQIPEPAAYVLHKFIIFKRRTKKAKKERDLQAATNIGEFLLQDNKGRKRLFEIFSSLPKKWQSRIKNNLKEHSLLFYDFLAK